MCRVHGTQDVVADQPRMILGRCRFVGKRVDKLVELTVDRDGTQNERVFGVCQEVSSVGQTECTCWPRRVAQRSFHPDSAMSPID